jgi:hypothetical protein
VAKLLPSSSTSTPSRFASSADPPPPWTLPTQLELAGEELQHLRQLSCVGSVQGHSGHEVAAFSVAGVVAYVRVSMVACLP